MNLLKDDRIGGEKQVEEAVDEGHINTEKQDDRLSNKEPQRSAEILSNELAKIDFDLFLLSMDPPVQGTTTQFAGFLDKYDWWIRFFKKQNIKAEG